MTLTRLQRFGPWLVGLFLIAQVAGVIPALYVDTLHEYEGASVVGHSQENVVGNLPVHHGDPADIHDGHDQCCALHHGMVGVVPRIFAPGVTSLASVRVEARADALASGNRSRLDRPPRSLPSLI